MNSRTQIAAALILALFGLTASMIAAQQDEGPVLKPNKVPSKPSMATILVMCDIACNWKLDGEAKGRIEGGGGTKIKVELGQHMVIATTEDGADQVKQLTDVKSADQKVINLELQPVRDARLKTERAARDARLKAEQQKRDQAAAQLKASQDARDKAEIVFWKSIESSSNPADFQTYLEQYPNGAFVALARRHLAEAQQSMKQQGTDPSKMQHGDKQFAVMHNHAGFGPTCKGFLNMSPEGIRYTCTRGEIHLSKGELDQSQVAYFKKNGLIRIKSNAGAYYFYILTPEDLGATSTWTITGGNEAAAAEFAESLQSLLGVTAETHDHR